MSLEDIQRNIREKIAAKAAAKGQENALLPPATPKPPSPPKSGSKFAPWAEFADAIPLTSDGYERSETELQIDEILGNLTVLDSYNRYCGKMRPKITGKREGIMISCPMPDHLDKRPSAWMNLDNNTWFCGGCQEGGDQYDIAAFHFGYDSQSYKSGQNWGIFRKTLAQDMGLVIEYIPGLGEVSYEMVDEDSTDTDTEPAPIVSTAPITTGTTQAGVAPSSGVGGLVGVAHTAPIDPEADVLAEDKFINHLDWRPLCPDNTFLKAFMDAVTIDDVPEEYHFWHAMMGLGLTVGRDVSLLDNPEVYANLFVCLLGMTGSGKSKAKRYLANVMHEAAPFQPKEEYPTGVKMIPTPASAEALIKAFQKDVDLYDAAGRKYKGYAPIRGFVEFTELKQLTTRMNRSGNALQPTLIDFFDAVPSVSSIAAGKDGERYAYRPFASVLTTVQPEVLSEVFSDSDEASGFLNRWLFVTGRRKKKQLFNRNIIKIGDAVVYLRTIHRWSHKGRKIVWSPEAEELFQHAWDTYIQADVDKNRTTLARIDLVIKKLGLILAINEMSDTVTKEMLERVLMMYSYLVRNVQFKTESMITSGDAKIDEEILDALKRCGPGLHSGRDITRKGSRLLREAGQPKIDRHLASLANSGYISMASVKGGKGGKGGGRPMKKYELSEEK